MPKIDYMHWFNKVTSVVLAVLLLFITLGIIAGVVRMFFNVGDLVLEHELTKQYLKIISDVLTLFVLIELSRSLIEYFDTRRLRMTFIVDAALVFVLREVMIKLFEHKLPPDEIYALSVLILVLAILRAGAVMIPPRARRDEVSSKIGRP